MCFLCLLRLTSRENVWIALFYSRRRKQFVRSFHPSFVQSLRDVWVDVCMGYYSLWKLTKLIAKHRQKLYREDGIRCTSRRNVQHKQDLFQFDFLLFADPRNSDAHANQLIIIIEWMIMRISVSVKFEFIEMLCRIAEEKQNWFCFFHRLHLWSEHKFPVKEAYFVEFPYNPAIRIHTRRFSPRQRSLRDMMQQFTAFSFFFANHKMFKL